MKIEDKVDPDEIIKQISNNLEKNERALVCLENKSEALPDVVRDLDVFKDFYREDIEKNWDSYFPGQEFNRGVMESVVEGYFAQLRRDALDPKLPFAIKLTKIARALLTMQIPLLVVVFFGLMYKMFTTGVSANVVAILSLAVSSLLFAYQYKTQDKIENRIKRKIKLLDQKEKQYLLEKDKE